MNPDRFVFLGDLCGYYPRVMECFAQLENLTPLLSLRGNHDDYFLKIHGGDESLYAHYKKKYGDTFPHLSSHDNFASRLFTWLGSLNSSYHLESENCFFTHGTINNPLEGRFYPNENATAIALDRLPKNVRFVLMGHTHYPVDTTHNGIRFINPGSVGQPRNGCPPSFFFLDTRSSIGTHVYYSYNRERFRNSIQHVNGLTKYSREVIWRY